MSGFISCPLAETLQASRSGREGSGSELFRQSPIIGGHHPAFGRGYSFYWRKTRKEPSLPIVRHLFLVACSDSVSASSIITRLCLQRMACSALISLEDAEMYRNVSACRCDGLLHFFWSDVQRLGINIARTGRAPTCSMTFHVAAKGKRVCDDLVARPDTQATRLKKDHCADLKSGFSLRCVRNGRSVRFGLCRSAERSVSPWATYHPAGRAKRQERFSPQLALFESGRPGYRAGDEVITNTAYLCCYGECHRACRARPVLADIDPEDVEHRSRRSGEGRHTAPRGQSFCTFRRSFK